MSVAPAPVRGKELARPRLGFLGVGWIGRHRLRALAESGVAEIAAVADLSAEAVREALGDAPGAAAADSLDGLLDEGVDGVVIATPSALHAEQATSALERGVGVFCQKPLARTAEDTRRIVAAARRADRLLGVDFSYRHTEGFARILGLVRAGELGRVYAADLTFHNAYGPDKAWVRDPGLSGGGCVIDLGVHLVDLALIALGHPRVVGVRSRLFAGGKPVTDSERTVEDYAVAEFTTAEGAVVRLACSWNLPAGHDCEIGVALYGTRGGACLRNVEGSFYDFRAEHLVGTSRRTLAEPPDAWGGRAIVAWARRLAAGEGFDAEAERLVDVAEVIDHVYGRRSEGWAGA